MRGKRIVTGILVLTLTAAMSIANAKPASAYTRLGGVSVYNACKYQYNAAYSWCCYRA